ncbi:peptidyl-tRNA hydrolase [Clostridiales bacterium]|nr:peptidyl-tRNA hydrolase [Clostridiales bacterium]
MNWVKIALSIAVIVFILYTSYESILAGSWRGKNMYVIIGLGNPGSEYADTKHNVGFRVIDRLGEKYNIDVNKCKHKALVGDGFIGGKRVMLVKPQTYMNLSGESVKDVMSFYKVPPENLLVIYDDTSLELGMIRLREKGSAGGHNGIKSIINHMGSDTFNRIKVGIGEKPNGWDLADYVLAKFSKDDEPLILSGIDKASQAAGIFISTGMKDTMNKFNAKQKIKVKKEDMEKKEDN